MASKKKVIIFGGLGYVGDPLIKLLRSEYDLTVVDPNWFDNDFRYDGVQYVEKSSFEIVSIDADFCVYLAAVSNDPMGANYSKQTYSVNEKEAVRIANLCRNENRDVRFILASSCSVYGAAGDHAKNEHDLVLPLTDYAKSKINAEQKLNEISGNGLNVVCLRFATACGASKSTRLDLALNDFVITSLNTGKIEVLSDGTPWRPFIHVDDMALAIRHSLIGQLKSAFEIYNVGSSQFTYTIKELAQNVADLTGGEVEINNKNASDSRSYTVDFAKFYAWYQGKWPTMDLNNTVSDLINFYEEAIIQFGSEHFNNFRNSKKYCRLKMLQSKSNIFIDFDANK